MASGFTIKDLPSWISKKLIPSLDFIQAKLQLDSTAIITFNKKKGTNRLLLKIEGDYTSIQKVEIAIQQMFHYFAILPRAWHCFLKGANLMLFEGMVYDRTPLILVDYDQPRHPHHIYRSLQRPQLCVSHPLWTEHAKQNFVSQFYQQAYILTQNYEGKIFY